MLDEFPVIFCFAVNFQSVNEFQLLIQSLVTKLSVAVHTL